MEHAVGNRVRGVRRARDLTQAQLAAMTGLNAITISRLENGTAKSIHGDTIVALARALGISADYLLGLAEPQSVTDTVTDTSHLRCLLDHDRRVFKAGKVTDPAHAWRMIQEEMRTVIAHAENVIAAIDTAEQRTGRVALETPRVTDTVTDTSPQTEAEQVAIRALQGVTDTITDTQSELSPNVTATVTDTEDVTDTVTVTDPSLVPFDTTKFYLGKLCPRNHDYYGTGHSLLRQHNQRCRECENESRREKRQAKREAQPVVG